MKVTRQGSTLAIFRLWQPMLFIGVVLLFWLAVFMRDNAPGAFGFDFRGTLWDAGRAITAGVSPYPPPDSPELASGNPALYPPFAIGLVLPLTWLPWNAALVLWMAVLLAGTLGGTWLLGVRDWRCYCVVLTSLPVINGVVYGNLTLLLLLAVGAAWRWRDRARLCGLAVGTAVVGKLFLWPLVVWLLIARRFRATAWAVVCIPALLIVPWAMIGFRGLLDYPALLRSAGDLYGPHSVSLVAAASGAGLPLPVARVVPAVAAVVLLVLAVRATRRPEGERRAFAITILAAIAGSPIVWNYYLTLLVAPVAVLRPRLSWLWLVFPVMYVTERLHGTIHLTAPAPDGAFYAAWSTLHSQPRWGPALGIGGLLMVVAIAALQLPIDAEHGEVERG